MRRIIALASGLVSVLAVVIGICVGGTIGVHQIVDGSGCLKILDGTKPDWIDLDSGIALNSVGSVPKWIAADQIFALQYTSLWRSPDGHALAVVDNKHGVYLIHTNGSTFSRPQFVDSSLPKKVWWSPDGQLMAFVGDTSSGQTLHILDSAGKTQFMANGPYIESYAWSADSTYFFYGVTEAPLFRLEQWSRTTEKAIDTHMSPPMGVYPSPVSNTLAVLDSVDVKGAVGLEVYTSGVGVQQTFSLSPGPNFNRIMLEWSPDGKFIAVSWLNNQAGPSWLDTQNHPLIHLGLYGLDGTTIPELSDSVPLPLGMDSRSLFWIGNHRLAYFEAIPIPQGSIWQLVTVDPPAAQRTILVQGSRWFDVQQTGTLKGRHLVLVLSNDYRQSRIVVTLTGHVLPFPADINPLDDMQLSPDGQTLAVWKLFDGNILRLVSTTTGGVKDIPLSDPTLGMAYKTLVWSSDSKQMAVGFDLKGSTLTHTLVHVVLVRQDGTKERQFTLGGTGLGHSLAWVACGS